MKPARLIVLVVGMLLGTLALVWWVRWRRLPTVRASYTLGKGGEIGLDWIELK